MSPLHGVESRVAGVAPAAASGHAAVMTRMTLFGTVTSPYVRRVRVVAHELGIDTELIDTFTPEGQAALRELSPVWKVPAARVDGEAIFDSAVITQYLLRRHGPGPLTAFDIDDTAARNLLTVIDGALDALINVFYLDKDGITGEQASYVAKQEARAASAMRWLDERCPSGDTFGLVEIALYTSVDWMRFRETYDVAQHPAIARFVREHATRESLAASAPPAS